MEFSFNKNCANLRELKEAIKIRDIRMIKDLLNNNPDIKRNQLDDHKLIHQVIHYAYGNHEQQASIIEILGLFLDFGVNVNVKNDEDCTVLHLAIDDRMSQVIDFLISRDANLHVRDKSGNSILHFLIKREIIRVDRFVNSFNENSIEHRQLKQRKKECADFIRWMILKGLDVDRQNNDGDTALHYLLKKHRRYFAKLILEYSKNVDRLNQDGNTPLNIIMDYGKDISYQYTNDDEEIVLALLGKGADVHKLNIYGISPLINAVKIQNLSFLQLFKKRGVDFRQSDKVGNLLHYFFKSKIAKEVQTQESVFDLLVDEGCDVNDTDDEGRVPLDFAVRGTDLWVVEKLIKSGANINRQDFTRGYAPLHQAVEHGREKIVTMLIENGANVNIKTKKGKTPLFLINSGSALQMCSRVVQRLQNRIRAFRGNSIQLGHIERYITRKLIERGAQIDVIDDDGCLPLQAAIRREDAALMNELLRFGADINDNTHVLTARDYQLLQQSIGRHVIKLQVANLPVDEKLKDLPTLLHDTRRIRENCLVEVESLKSYKINDSTSLYNFLHTNRNSTCTYVKNEKLMELINSPSFEKRFPMYHVLISSTYHMAIERKKMLEPAKQTWLELTGIRLPDLCLYEIFNYVSNVTLRSMIEGAE